MADKYNLGTVGGMAVTELWSGSVGNLIGSNIGTKITLNDDITNYKFLIFDFCSVYSADVSAKRYYSRVISVQQFTNVFNDANANTAVSFNWGYGSATEYFDIQKNSTTKVLNFNSSYTQCLRILGIN